MGGREIYNFLTIYQEAFKIFKYPCPLTCQVLFWDSSQESNAKYTDSYKKTMQVFTADDGIYKNGML